MQAGLASCLVLTLRAFGWVPSSAAIGGPQRSTDRTAGAGDRRGRNASALHPLYLPRTPSSRLPSALVQAALFRLPQPVPPRPLARGQRRLPDTPRRRTGRTQRSWRPRRLPRPRRQCPFHLVSKDGEFSAPLSCQASQQPLPPNRRIPIAGRIRVHPRLPNGLDRHPCGFSDLHVGDAAGDPIRSRLAPAGLPVLSSAPTWQSIANETVANIRAGNAVSAMRSRAPGSPQRRSPACIGRRGFNLIG
jgi:hypothetical protein